MTYPDYFMEGDEPVGMMVRSTTNERYRFFRQNYFTAGDYEQFLDNFPCFDGKCNDDQEIPIRTFPCFVNMDCPLYKSLCVHDFFNTFLYLFDKMKKGVFVHLTSYKLHTYLPFSKVNYQNEWSSSIRVDPRLFKNINDLMAYTASLESKTFVQSRVHQDIRSWYGNNGLVRLEFPTSESDNGLNMLKDMFECLVRERKLPSQCSFYLNKRDFPLLKKDGTEPYDAFFGRFTKLKSHSYHRYAPILSMTTSPDYADIPIPTWDDWCRVSYQHERKIFWKDFRRYPLQEEFDSVLWENKIPTAIFRGASTGLGTDVTNNIRLFYAKESMLKKCDESDGTPYIDVGITTWNLRPRKHPDSPYLDTIHIDRLGIPLVQPLTPLEQCRYKYILHLPGHSEAYRLSLELSSGSLVLLYPCPFELWYSRWLVPWKHYVPIDPSIPDDIYKKIQWCKDHDDECRNIVQQARLFVQRYLTRESILDYLQSIIVLLSKQQHDVQSFSLVPIFQKTMNDDVSSFENRWISSIQCSDILGTWIDHFFHTDQTILITDHHPIHRPLFIIFMWIKFSKQSIHDFLDKTLDENMLTIETKKAVVTTHTFRGLTWISKKSPTPPTLLYSYYYLNELSMILPFFMYMYSAFHDPVSDSYISISQYIHGVTLEKKIMNDMSFSFDHLLYTYVSIALGLHYAQNYCGFLHMDLYPWNVIIVDKPVSISLPWKNSRYISFQSPICPVMIDYDRSFLIHETIPIYHTRPFYHNRLQDIISMVFSSLFLFITHRNIDVADQNRILRLMQFFSTTRFYSMHQIKSFLKYKKKYSNMTGSRWKHLENISPIDFIQYLMDHDITPRPSPIQFHTTSPKNIVLPIYSSLHHDLDVFQVEIETLQLLRSVSQKDVVTSLYEELLSTMSTSMVHHQDTISAFIYEHRISHLFTIMDRTENFVRTTTSPSSLKKSIHRFRSTISSLQSFIFPELPIVSTHVCKTCVSRYHESHFAHLSTLELSPHTIRCFFILSFIIPTSRLHADYFHPIWSRYFRKQAFDLFLSSS